MNRKEQQEELIYKVGLLLRPIEDVIARPDDFDADARARLRAQFHVDHQRLSNELNAYCKSEPGHEYSMESHDIQTPLAHMNNHVRKMLVDRPTELGQLIADKRRELIRAIGAVPTTVDSTIYESSTPFSTYCRLRELCGAVSSTLVFCDRYIAESIFHRYLSIVSPHVQITLLTWPRSKHGNKKPYDDFIDVSRLFAQERPGKYRLLTEPTFHDRLLRCDDQLFHLGGSIKDAGRVSVYTLSKVDATPKNFKRLDDLLALANEVFGPTNTTHP